MVCGHSHLTAEDRALLLHVSCATLKRRSRRLGNGERRAYRAPRERAAGARVSLRYTLSKPSTSATFAYDSVEHHGSESRDQYTHTTHWVDVITA